MTENKLSLVAGSVDHEDALELDEHFFTNAEVSVGRTVLREATDTMAKRGRGHPPRANPQKFQ